MGKAASLVWKNPNEQPSVPCFISYWATHNEFPSGMKGDRLGEPVCLPAALSESDLQLDLMILLRSKLKHSSQD